MNAARVGTLFWSFSNSGMHHFYVNFLTSGNQIATMTVLDASAFKQELEDLINKYSSKIIFQPGENQNA